MNNDITTANPPWGQQSLFDSQNAIPVARLANVLVAPNGAQISLLAIDDSGRRFVPIGQIGTAIGYNDYDITSTRAVNAELTTLCYLSQRPNGKKRQVMGNCIDVKDISSALRQYINYTFGARQGSMKYRRNVEATRLLTWWMAAFRQE